jgi:hypothetical protein
MTSSGLAPAYVLLPPVSRGTKAAHARFLTYTFSIVAPVANLLDNPIHIDSQLQGDWNFDLWTGADTPVTASPDARPPVFPARPSRFCNGPRG